MASRTTAHVARSWGTPARSCPYTRKSVASISAGEIPGTRDSEASSASQRWYSMSATARYPQYSAANAAIDAGSRPSASLGNCAWRRAILRHPWSQSRAATAAARASMNFCVSLPGASSGSGVGGSGGVQSSPASAGFWKKSGVGGAHLARATWTHARMGNPPAASSDSASTLSAPVPPRSDCRTYALVARHGACTSFLAAMCRARHSANSAETLS
mmetsp:Transcript_10134/g.39594  ORF Transcript_10134/g.39594 Transcript_10134/m.39594 type:complete len:216 (-) Transcript_10134:772-1419(-)